MTSYESGSARAGRNSSNQAFPCNTGTLCNVIHWKGVLLFVNLSATVNGDGRLMSVAEGQGGVLGTYAIIGEIRTLVRCPLRKSCAQPTAVVLVDTLC
jgi:hypothetical protein